MLYVQPVAVEDSAETGDSLICPPPMLVQVCVGGIPPRIRALRLQNQAVLGADLNSQCALLNTDHMSLAATPLQTTLTDLLESGVSVE